MSEAECVCSCKKEHQSRTKQSIRAAFIYRTAVSDNCFNWMADASSPVLVAETDAQYDDND